MARSRLQSKHMGNELLAKVIGTTVYILNHSPTLAIKNCSPKGGWSDRIPSVVQFLVF